MGKYWKLLDASGKPCVSATPGLFGGHRRSRIFGKMDCRAALRAIERGGYVRYRVFFADAQTALSAGYRPCAICLPREYATWKAQRSNPAQALCRAIPR